MRKLPFFPLLMLMIPLLAGAADTHHEMAGMNEENNSGTLSAASKAYLDSMKNMHQQMDAGVRADDPDVAFAQGMIPHHEGAIHMAEVELKYGKDPAMRKLAENVISAQKAEIATMQQWLAAHGQKK
ncbi:hypothetical protein Sant_1645 [Sodalis praecaptivus]|uniref:DUF305 domain-containing protein n=1 Tax=Sodalis praecaptivus TaxID=1239307 RepID=W0HWW7_9GAMM|nr:DUF305 domain-containing protein [Sodalis praecaptivus]AHF76700.1 hypothetical protein Sant_1645 [Sodalis praecaptivus]CAJ0998443.1 hypothetical protein NVIRENTERO_03328 [Sodalis praecaptivus]